MTTKATVSPAASGTTIRITWPRPRLSHLVSTRYHGSKRAPAITTWAIAAPAIPSAQVQMMTDGIIAASQTSWKTSADTAPLNSVR